jgi:hypothetical protein
MMTAIPGVRVTGTIVPTDTTDTYPVTDPVYGIDGWRSVADAATRNAIPDARRRQGMMANQQDTGVNYQLLAPPWIHTDADWTVLSAGISSIPTGNTVWVDAVNGNNGTGTRGRQDKPFLTIAAAVTASASGDLIIIRPGAYTTTTNLFKAGISIYSEPDVTISYTGVLIQVDGTNNTVFNFVGFAALIATGITSALASDNMGTSGSNWVIAFKSHSVSAVNAAIGIDLAGANGLYVISSIEGATFNNSTAAFKSSGSSIIVFTCGSDAVNGNGGASTMFDCGGGDRIIIKAALVATGSADAGSIALKNSTAEVSVTATAIEASAGTAILSNGAGSLNVSVSGRIFTIDGVCIDASDGIVSINVATVIGNNPGSRGVIVGAAQSFVLNVAGNINTYGIALNLGGGESVVTVALNISSQFDIAISAHDSGDHTVRCRDVIATGAQSVLIDSGKLSLSCEAITNSSNYAISMQGGDLTCTAESINGLVSVDSAGAILHLHANKLNVAVLDAFQQSAAGSSFVYVGEIVGAADGVVISAGTCHIEADSITGGPYGVRISGGSVSVESGSITGSIAVEGNAGTSFVRANTITSTGTIAVKSLGSSDMAVAADTITGEVAVQCDGGTLDVTAHDIICTSIIPTDGCLVTTAGTIYCEAVNFISLTSGIRVSAGNVHVVADTISASGVGVTLLDIGVVKIVVTSLLEGPTAIAWGATATASLDLSGGGTIRASSASYPITMGSNNVAPLKISNCRIEATDSGFAAIQLEGDSTQRYEIQNCVLVAGTAAGGCIESSVFPVISVLVSLPCSANLAPLGITELINSINVSVDVT